MSMFPGNPIRLCSSTVWYVIRPVPALRMCPSHFSLRLRMFLTRLKEQMPQRSAITVTSKNEEEESGSKLKPRPKPKQTMPTWAEAARAVFSSSEEGESELNEVDSLETDYIPKHHRSSFLYYKTPTKQTRANDVSANDMRANDENAIDEWATPLPQHLLPTPSPTLPSQIPPAPYPKEKTDTELWAKSIPQHLLPTPSPQQRPGQDHTTYKMTMTTSTL